MSSGCSDDEQGDTVFQPITKSHCAAYLKENVRTVAMLKQCLREVIKEKPQHPIDFLKGYLNIEGNREKMLRLIDQQVKEYEKEQELSAHDQVTQLDSDVNSFISIADIFP
ncbi:uncharacterized protein LOC119661909 [Teleopsis dalmanni]|uniref:uncharacterized protein LOC119661909 n=1 Tax=Teleopsis dalmanni TaxID=139649 RepID=UPI0018CF1047|nr:uncharacterized protein LOC119661909 [Teleopsis dalmanni]XP_037927349.1 uncharacterized protein LOC119661909 [Teleopsis dalmanni]